MKDQKERSKKKTAFLIHMPVLCIALVFILCKSCSNTPEPPPTYDLSQRGELQSGDVSSISQEEIQAELDEKVTEGMIDRKSDG